MRFYSWLILSANYDEMFKGLLKIQPDLGLEIQKEILWAKTILKRADRITWYLRWVRLYLEEKKEPELLKKDLKAYNSKTKVKISEDDIPASLNGVKSKLEHFMGFDDTLIQNKVWEYQTPNTMKLELGALEDEIRVKMESETRTVAEPEDDSGDTIFIRFGNGWAWWLLDRYYCSEEARAMGHCGNQPGKKTDRILSLREPIQRNKVTRWSPHLTFIQDENGLLGEMKGRNNDKPVQRYHPYIITLLKDQRIKGLKGATWLTEHNFKLTDLTPEQIADIQAANPNIQTLDSLLKKHGKNPETIRRVAAELHLDDDSYRPEWDAFVVNEWATLKDCVDSIGNGNADEGMTWALGHYVGDMGDARYEDDLPDYEDMSKVVKAVKDSTLRSMSESLLQEVPGMVKEFETIQKQYDPSFVQDATDANQMEDLLYFVAKGGGENTRAWQNVRRACIQAARYSEGSYYAMELEDHLRGGGYREPSESEYTELRFGDDDEFRWDASPVYEIITFDNAVSLGESGDEDAKNLAGSSGLQVYVSEYSRDDGDPEYSREASDQLNHIYERGIPRDENANQLDLFTRPEVEQEAEPEADLGFEEEEAV